MDNSWRLRHEIVLNVFIASPINKVLGEFLEAFKLYQNGEVSEEAFIEAKERYDYVVNVYTWRSG